MLGVLAIVGLQVGLFLFTYYTRDEEIDPKDRENIRKGSTTIAKEGDSVPLVYGKCRVRKTNILLYNGAGSFQDYLRDSWNTVDGRKEYVVDLLLGVCVRPLASAVIEFKRAWAGDSLLLEDLVHNVQKNIHLPNLWGGPGLGGGVSGNLTAQDGNASQTESVLAALTIFGVNGPQVSTGDSYGAAPGICTMFLNSFKIGEQASMPGISVEMVCYPDFSSIPIRSTVNGLSATSTGVHAGDANPAAALYQVLTDPWVGLGLPTDKINAASFNTAGITLDGEGNGFSMVFEKPTPAKKIIQEIIKQIDGILYMDPETQELHLVLVREDYGAYPYAGLTEFGDVEGNVLELMSYKETSWVDTFNQVRIEFEDRNTEYNTKFAVSQNSAGATSAGRLKSKDISFPGVKNAALANAIASREMKFFGTPQTSVMLKVNRQGGSLRPGDVFKWSYSINQIEQITDMVLRVHRISLGDLNDGSIVLECTRDKYSNVTPVFADPDRHYFDNFGEKPEAPEWVVGHELPWAPIAPGSDNWDTPGRDQGHVIHLVGLQTTLEAPVFAALDTSNDLGISYASASNKPVSSVPVAQVDTAYAKEEGPYYDVSTGLIIKNISDVTVLRTSTEEDIRAGKNTLLVGGEFISYETFTDLTGGRYRLNNVWRGLMDTMAVDQKVDDGVFFLSELPIQDISSRQRITEEGDVLFKTTYNPARAKQQGQSPTIVSGITITRRAQRALRATQFTVTSEGPDSLASEPEVRYAYNESDLTETSIGIASGQQDVVTTTALDVWTNDLFAQWARRATNTAGTDIVVRGDDADQPFEPNSDVRIQIEGKGEYETEWRVLSDRTIDGVNFITGPQDFFNVGLMPEGPGQLRLCSHRNMDDSGKDACSHTAEVIDVEVSSARQLVINRKFRPFWDVTAENDGTVFGVGAVTQGNGEQQAREWTNITEATSGSVVKFVPHSAPLVQGASVTADDYCFTADFVTNDWVYIEQIIPIPSVTTTFSTMELSLWVYKASASDEKSAVMVAYDDAGVVKGTATVLFSTGTIGRWYQESVTALLGAGTTTVKITLGLRVTSGTTGPAMDYVTATMSGYTQVDQLTDGDFASLAGWTHTGWTSVASSGGLLPVDSTGGNFAKSPSSASDSSLSQTVTIPVGFAIGDYARLQVVAANTGVDSLVGVILRARDSSNVMLSEKIVTAYENGEVDKWAFHELYVKLPETTDHIYVELLASPDAANTDAAFDQANLTFLRADSRKTQLDWKQAQLQARPVTPHAFSSACEDLRITPTNIFPMQDGLGVAPVDVLNAATLDEATGVSGTDYTLGSVANGLFDGTDHTSVRGLELSTPSGGVAASDTSFLDPVNRSFGVYMQYRLVEGSTGKFSVMAKGGPYKGLASDTQCFQMWYEESTHKIHFAVSINSTAAGSFDIEAEMAGTPDDTCWHWLYARVDMTAQAISIWGDVDAGNGDQSITAMIDALEAQGETFENATDKFTMGRDAVVTGVYDDGPVNPFQCCYLAILRDKASEKFTRSMGQTLWAHGKDQNLKQTGQAITYVRTSRVGYEVAQGQVAMWSGSAGGGEVQVPLQYNEGFTGVEKLGLGSFPTQQNLVTYANDLSQWTGVNATSQANAFKSERGLCEMHEVINPISLGGYVARTVTGLTASTTYTVSAFHAAGKVSIPTQIDIMDHALTGFLVNHIVTTSSVVGKVLRTNFTFTTDVGQTQTQIRLRGHVDASPTATVGWHGIMITEGLVFGPVIYNDIDQNGSLETLSTQTQELPMSASDLCSPDVGSIYSVYAQEIVDTQTVRTVAAVHGGTGTQAYDERSMRIEIDGTARAETRNAVGTIYQTTFLAHAALTADTEYERLLRWRRRANLDHQPETLLDDIIEPSFSQLPAGGTANTKSVGGHTRVLIACSVDGSKQLCGPLQTLRLYAGEVDETKV